MVTHCVLRVIFVSLWLKNILKNPHNLHHLREQTNQADGADCADFHRFLSLENV